MDNTLNISTTTLRNIINRRFRVSIGNKSRKREIIEARFIYYSICYHDLKMSLASIGRTTKQDHATVLHGIKRVDEWYEIDGSFKRKYDEVHKIARDMDSLKTKETKKEHETRLSSVTSEYEIAELKRKLNSLETEYNKLMDKYVDVCSKKSLLGEMEIPEEHIEDVKERVELYLKSLKWKGSGYDGKIYNSSENISANTY